MPQPDGSQRTAPSVTIRPLETEADYEACVTLQRETWGENFLELAPPALLMITQKVGGITAGAFDERGRLVGFVFGLTGLQEGRAVHWSHMLAVTERLRGHGIGQQLKHYQRNRLRTVGVTRMYWTYDPLVARNAHLNVNRLGARIMEYVQDMYGENPLSETDSVIGSDRFVVRWDLDTEHEPAPPTPVAEGGPQPLVTLDLEAPATVTGELPDDSTVFVEVPADIQRLKKTHPSLAHAWRLLTRRAFIYYLDRGYIIGGLARERAIGRCYYILGRHQG